MSNKIKEFGLSAWAVKNKTSVYVMMAIVVILGFMSYSSMPKESYPEIKLPTIYVSTPYPGNSPLDMENLVTRPIEKEINSISGVTKLTSTSIQDFSIIVVEFNFDITSSAALQKVKDAIDKSKPDLPSDLPADPDAIELNFADFPILNVNISGDYSQNQLKEYAEIVQDEIEALPEISEVDLTGLTEEEVEIAVDRVKMEALEISLRDIENAISQENLAMSGGDILSISGDDRNRRSLRIDGEVKQYQDLGDFIVKSEYQNIVYLKDIADITFGQKEATSYARLSGLPVVALDVKKNSGANILSAAAKINTIIDYAKTNLLPKDLEIVITNDQSRDTKAMVNELENSIIMGVILVVLVLVFFLGLRNSVFVGIAIPLSMLMAIAYLNFTGSTLNFMVLFSLILALGMLVDNGIVVVENIFRLRVEEGTGAEQASVQGVSEVAWPIIASTATTLAAFLPLMIWPGMIGEFMKYLPLTLIIVLASSLFVALVINPVLTADLMKDNEAGKKSKARKFWLSMILMLLIGVALFFIGVKLLGGLLFAGVLLSILNRYILKPGGDLFMAKAMPRIEKAYANTARRFLKGKRPIVVLVVTFIMLIGSIAFFAGSNPDVVFFPKTQPKYVNVFIEAPLGTDIEKTDRITKILESRIQDSLAPYGEMIEAILAQVGDKTADPNSGPQMGSSPHLAKIVVSFLPYKDRVFMKGMKSTSDIMKIIKSACLDFPEAKTTVAQNSDGPPVGKPINVEVTGDDYLTLITEMEKVKIRMEQADIAGVDQLQTDLELGKPMLDITIDRGAARRFGLSTVEIASTIRTALLGKEIGKFKEGEDDYKIQLRFNEDYRYNLSNLLNTKHSFRDMASGKISQVPISAVCSIDFNSTYGSVKRKDTKRVISIFSEITPGANANTIVAEYKQILEDFPLKDGYEIKFTGEQAEQAETMEFLIGALALAIFLIFLIIVTQFNSIIGPLIILGSVLFSTIGVFLGFGITGFPFSILMSGIGIVSLAGIVVNNAIVLIDYINLLRTRKRAELGLEEGANLPAAEILNSIVDGGATRLRPVLLTAITTVLGLIPLAVGINVNFHSLLTSGNPMFYVGGENADFWAPMAWTIIFGLVFATFLTLLVVPAMYIIADKVSVRIKRRMNRN